jgi:hypothetical protein
VETLNFVPTCIGTHSLPICATTGTHVGYSITSWTLESPWSRCPTRVALRSGVVSSSIASNPLRYTTFLFYSRPLLCMFHTTSNIVQDSILHPSSAQIADKKIKPKAIVFPSIFDHTVLKQRSRDNAESAPNFRTNFYNRSGGRLVGSTPSCSLFYKYIRNSSATTKIMHTATLQDGWPTINCHRKPVTEQRHMAATNLNVQSQRLLSRDWFRPEPRLNTFLTPVVTGMKYLPFLRVTSTGDHILISLFCCTLRIFQFYRRDYAY